MVRYFQRCVESAVLYHVECDNIGICVDSSGDVDEGLSAPDSLWEHRNHVLYSTYILAPDNPLSYVFAEWPWENLLSSSVASEG
jgi:hypothetical protein